jgi:hypothetical protein
VQHRSTARVRDQVRPQPTLAPFGDKRRAHKRASRLSPWRCPGGVGLFSKEPAGYRRKMTIPEEPTPIEPQPEPNPPSPIPDPESVARCWTALSAGVR